MKVKNGKISSENFTILGNFFNPHFAVLKCLAVYYPDSGYVQGMNFLCTMLMSYTTPEDSFVIMVSLMKNYGLKELFEPGFPGLKKYYYILITLVKKYLPKVFKKLE